MTAPLQLAVIGLGRIGSFHARHVAELAARDPGVQLTAIVDPREDLDALVQDFARIQGNPVRQFRSLAPPTQLGSRRRRRRSLSHATARRTHSHPRGRGPARAS